jgi:DNA mismatch repair protein MutL
MADIIQLLPDSIANQIAAGEVIQRPASVVKELLENSIDAGSSQIKLIIKDAGKGLVQVIDNGCGMSETDARMSFERHATSKIRSAQDLFAIRTMGFRGEAMASIAAVAQVEMRTRRHDDELGVRLVIEGSEVKTQEPCQCTSGTSIAVKNLFFNVPARRNFLKSTTVEMRHIIDEFQRVALAHPDIFFSLHHNNNELFHLPSSNLRQRIVGIFGNNYNKKLVPVAEETDIMKLEGFIGKPEFAKKSRGEQFFFVNDRFIKSYYLNHAVMGAYEDLLNEGSYPFYILFIDIDPSRIDINVHPTKQEIKFEDERLIYNYLKVGVRHALGQHSVIPSLDFETDVNFGSSTSGGKLSKDSYTFSQPSSNPKQPRQAGTPNPEQPRQASNLKNWEQLYQGLDAFDTPETPAEHPSDTDARESLTIESSWNENSELDDRRGSFSKQQKKPYQIHSTYIVSQIKSGFMLVDQQAAHERILYEKYFNALSENQTFIQKELFPRTISLSPADAAMLKDILPQVNALGFDIQEFGQTEFVIQGVPADLASSRDEQQVVESILEQFRQNLDVKLDIRENIARSLARGAAIKRGQKLSPSEMQELIDKLFACEMPYKSPAGRNTFIMYELEALAKRFEG